MCCWVRGPLSRPASWAPEAGQAGFRFFSLLLCSCCLGTHVGRRGTNQPHTVSPIIKSENPPRFFSMWHPKVLTLKGWLPALYYPHFGKAVFSPPHLCSRLIQCYFLPAGLCRVPQGAAFSYTERERQRAARTSQRTWKLAWSDGRRLCVFMVLTVKGWKAASAQEHQRSSFPGALVLCVVGESAGRSAGGGEEAVLWWEGKPAC